MWTHFFMFLSLAAGVFTGMGGALLVFFGLDKENEPEKRHPFPPQEPDISSDNEVELPEIPLTRKIPPKDFSAAEFNCSADGLDADAYIATHQQQQDDAYNTLKRRKLD